MIPFRVAFKPGASLYEQVVYAAKKALVSGQLRAGDPFPSVRMLSAELKINPNTAHKVVTQLLNEGLLEVMPGTGTVVAQPPDATTAQRSKSANTCPTPSPASTAGSSPAATRPRIRFWN